MTRINSNIPSLIAQNRLMRTNADLAMRLERLSTGLRLNRGSDDPAGLIISERIRSDLAGISQGLRNGERASAVIATTEGALAEVSDLLNSVRALIVEAANTGANSKEEREANQLQIDSAIDSITRISNTATFGGLKLLDGSRDYTVSGIATSAISQAKILSASFFQSSSINVEVDVVASAQVGALYLNGDISPVTGELASSVTLEIRGPIGVTTLQFTSTTTLDSLVNAVNNLTAITGVKAELINGNANSGMVFQAAEFGSGAFVSVTRLNKPDPSSADNWQLQRFADGTPVPSDTPFDWAAPTLLDSERDSGQDVTALINGILASGDGLTINVSSPSLSLELLLNEDHATIPTATPTTFTITGGGAIFQLGPDVNALQQVNVGIASVTASQLGGTLINGSLEFLSSIKRGQGNSLEESIQRGDFSAASAVLDKAIDEVSLMRGRLGALERNVLDTNTRSLQAAFENLSASNALIRDADFAAETSALTRAQILSSSGTSVLLLANQQSQQVLQLLG